MNTLKRLLITIALMFPVSSYAATASEDLISALTKLHSFKADFVQSVLDGRGSIIQKSSGQMALQRPGKFRWETQKPGQQLVIADGKKVWFYDIDLQQVTVQKQQTTQPNSPALLLNGEPIKLAKDYIITQPANGIYQLKPKQTNSMFNIIELGFQNNNLNIIRLQDSFGQITTVQFKNVDNNPNLPARLFQFVLPKGVDVVRQ